MCKYAVKKLPYLLRYLPYQYQTQKSLGKAILENVGTLESVLDCYKNLVMSNKTGDNYTHNNSFLNIIRLKKYVIKQLVDVFYTILFLMNIN